MKWRLEDTLEAFSVHEVGGIIGALLTGVFASRGVNAAAGDGLLAGDAAQLGVQAPAVLVTIVYSGGMTFLLLNLAGLVTPVRSEPLEEEEGLDLVEDGEKGYRELT